MYQFPKFLLYLFLFFLPVFVTILGLLRAS